MAALEGSGGAAAVDEQAVLRAVEELRAVLGEERVVLDPDEREAHAKPWNSYHKLDALPAAVVYPKSTEEVAAIVKACLRHRVPVTPYGGGTSLEAGMCPARGGVSIDMNLMKELKEVHEADLDCVVEPGVGWVELNERLQPLGLFFPLDPGPGATVGGMCATRCSGSLAVRYGTMRDNVLSITAVLANGDVVRTSARARKSAAGYDLTRLLVGSEGTLAVITEVTLRLQRIPEASAVASCTFPSVRAAAATAIDVMHSGIQVSRVELLDEVTMRALNLANGWSRPERPTLLFELVGTPAYVAEQVARVQAIAQSHDGSRFAYADTPEEKVALWRARKEALWACYALKPGTEPMITDVCVPLSRLAECIDETKRELDATWLPCPLLAHSGDGNFHVLIFVDVNRPQDVAEAQRLAHNIVKRALAMDGTCTGEHGVGIGKREYLVEELGAQAVAMMGTIKKALDPAGIMNPGKVLPSRFCL